MDLKQKVMAGLRWSAGMRLIGQLFTWAATIIVIRLLTPGDYGLMAMAGVFITFLGMINEMGLGAAIIQRKDLDQATLQSIFGLILLVSLLFSCLLGFGAPLISEFYKEPKLSLMLWVLSIVFLLSGLAVLPRCLLLKELQYKKIATIEFISAISGSICTLILAVAGMGVWSLVGGYIVIRLVLLVCANIAHPFLFVPTFRLNGMGKIFSYSARVAVSRILWFLYASAAANLIVGKTLGKESLGIYGVGLYMACLPMEKLGGIINQVAFPAFSSIQDNPHLAGAHFLKAVRILCFIAIPIFWGISSIAQEIVGVFLGDVWLDAILPLQIISFVVPLRMVRNLMNPALIGLGRADIDLKNEIVAVSLIPLGFLIATAWGVIGVSLVWVIVFPVVFIINLENARKILCFSFVALYREMWKPVISGLVMYLSIITLKNTSIVEFTLYLNMLIYIALGICVYIGATLLLNRQVVREVISLVRS